jgi:hypothetical protein
VPRHSFLVFSWYVEVNICQLWSNLLTCRTKLKLNICVLLVQKLSQFVCCLDNQSKTVYCLTLFFLYNVYRRKKKLKFLTLNHTINCTVKQSNFSRLCTVEKEFESFFNFVWQVSVQYLSNIVTWLCSDGHLSTILV